MQEKENMPEYQLNAKIIGFKPYDLNLITSRDNLSISADINLKGKGNTAENIVGFLNLKNIDLISDSLNINIDSIYLNAITEENGIRIIKLISPYINIDIDGNYNISTIVPTSRNILHPYLPTFFKHTDLSTDKIHNNFRYKIVIENTEDIGKIFHLPISFGKKGIINGELNDETKRMMLFADIPSMKYGSSHINNNQIIIKKTDKMYVFDINSTLDGKGSPLDIKLHTEIENDVVLLNIIYDNEPSDFLLKGDIKSLFTFKTDNNNDLAITAHFLPSDIKINNLDIGFEPAIITFVNDKIVIDNFGLTQNNSQFIGINGVVSKSNTDSLLVTFNKASVHNLLGGLNISDIRSEERRVGKECRL